MDRRVEDAILVHWENNQKIKFTHCGHGIYYFDNTNVRHMNTPHNRITEDEIINKSKISVTGYSFVFTVATNKYVFTQHEIGGADNARILLVRI